jgi:hypothetical protein
MSPPETGKPEKFSKFSSGSPRRFQDSADFPDTLSPTSLSRHLPPDAVSYSISIYIIPFGGYFLSLRLQCVCARVARRRSDVTSRESQLLHLVCVPWTRSEECLQSSRKLKYRCSEHEKLLSLSGGQTRLNSVTAGRPICCSPLYYVGFPRNLHADLLRDKAT